MRYAFVSDPPPEHEEPLDAYSRVVTFVAERLSPSVANLRLSRRVRGGRVYDSGGSGVVITGDGFMLTSAHVVAASDGRGMASFSDGRELGFELIGADPLSDLAVVRAAGETAAAELATPKPARSSWRSAQHGFAGSVTAGRLGPRQGAADALERRRGRSRT
jgi:S1-C subfamily serine protease